MVRRTLPKKALQKYCLSWYYQIRDSYKVSNECGPGRSFYHIPYKLACHFRHSRHVCPLIEKLLLDSFLLPS